MTPVTSWQGAVERTVTGLGYELVDTERTGGGLLRVYIDRVAGDPNGEFITVEDCEKVTRQLQHVLEVENCEYARLEVSSPGLDRPLKKPADFERFAGEEVDLRLHNPIENARKLKGILRGCENGAVVVETAKGSLTIPLTEVDRARLVPKIEWR